MADITDAKIESETQPHVVALHADASVLPASVGSTEPDWTSRRLSWEIMAQILAGAAGLGVLVLVLGAVVAWVRLVAVGLPPEEGLSAMSSQALLVAGAHVLVVPVVLMASGWLAGSYMTKVDAQWENQPDDARLLPVRIRVKRWVQKRWPEEKNAGEVVAKDDDAVAPHGLFARLQSWVGEGTIKGLVVLVPLLPIWVYARLIEFLRRHRLMFLWWVVALPFTWTWVGMAVSFSLAWSWSKHVHDVGPRMGWTARGIGRRVFAGFAVASVAAALASQLGQPPHFAPATVTLRSGQAVKGLLVASGTDAVYLGRSGNLVEFARADVNGITVGHAKTPNAPDALIVQLFNSIF